MVKDVGLVHVGKLSTILAPEVFTYLSHFERIGILQWLDDALWLVSNCRIARDGVHPYYDYSFMITPAFKALEKWLLCIAPALGVEEAKVKAAEEKGRFGAFLNDNYIEEIMTDIATRLDLQADKQKEMRSSLRALESYLKNLRHTPAHCSSIVENPDRAETVVRQIIGAIDDLTSHLLREKVIV